MHFVATMSIIDLQHTASGATCRIHELGATVLGYRNAAGRDVLLLSRDAILDGSKAIRGGIPLVFPIFGPPSDDKSTMPQHGFARNNKWTKLSTFDNEDAAGAQFQLLLDDVSAGRGTNNPWEGKDYNVKLVFDIRFDGQSLTTALRMENTGSVAFSFQALLHTYYAVDDHAALDPSRCHVKGLAGYEAHDKVTGAKSLASDEPVTIDGEVDRVYTPPAGQVNAKVEISVGTAHPVSLQCQGTIDESPVPVSVVVWNPHEAKAASMGDFGNDQYHEMICVEPGILLPATLEAGKVAVLEQVIRS